MTGGHNNNYPTQLTMTQTEYKDHASNDGQLQNAPIDSDDRATSRDLPPSNKRIVAIESGHQPAWVSAVCIQCAK